MQTIESLTELLRMAHEQIDTEVAKNAELEKQLSSAQTMGDREQSIRDLEQQAKGVENAKEYYSHKWDDEFESVTVNIMKKGEGYIYPEGLGEYSQILRNEAKALKDPS